MFRTNGFYYHTNLATENIPVCSFSSNRFKTSDKLIITLQFPRTSTYVLAFR